jgi:hypothetical protein
MYWEKSKAHREVRMTVNLRKSAKARMTDKKKGKFLSGHKKSWTSFLAIKIFMFLSGHGSKFLFLSDH